MIEEIRKEICMMEESATRLQSLAQENIAIRKNADIILIYLRLLKFITPIAGETP